MTLVLRDLTANSAAVQAAPQNTFYRNALKRALDLLLVILAMPIWLPVVLIGAALVATDGKTPFYFQERVGRNGRIFWIWKLRTMVVDADARLEAYLDANPEAPRRMGCHPEAEKRPPDHPCGPLFPQDLA